MAVPDTTTFTFQNVVDEVNPTTDDLISCFSTAISPFFNTTYEGSKNNLLNFRDYGVHNSSITLTSLPESLSFLWNETTIKDVVVSCSDGAWTVKSATSWTNYTIINTALIKISVDTNTGPARTGYVILESAWDPSVTATITV